MFNTVDKSNPRALGFAQFACLTVAITASLISVAIAILVGMQRSDSGTEKVIFAGIGCIGVLGAHMLLPLSQNRPFSTRALGMVLWVLCSAYVGYGHSAFFIAAQERAGLHRSEQFQSRTPPKSKAPTRELSDALTELAKVRGNLAAIALSTCQNDCAKKQLKVSVLSARVQALEAEAEEIRAWRLERSAEFATLAALKEDPITSRLSKTLEMQSTTVSLVTAVFFALMLEAVACYCWFLVLTLRDSAVTHQSLTVTTNLTGPDLTDLDRHVALVITEMQAGRLNCSVRAIREFLGCAQAHARAVRAQIEAKSIAIQALPQ